MSEGTMTSGTRVFASGATRDASDNKLDYEGFISPIVLRRFAEYMHSKRTANVPAGETLRASDNWQKGIPLDAYIKSAMRHFMELWLLHRGFEAHDEKGNAVDIETALCGLHFNIDGYLHEYLKGARPMHDRQMYPLPQAGA